MTRSIIRLTVLALMAVVFVFSAACSSEKSGSGTTASTSSGKYDGVSSKTLNMTARYFAGLKQPAGSPLAARTKTARYAGFRTRMNRYWRRFRATTFQRIRNWQKREVADLDRSTILYPFSGPDFLNVYAVYPEADRYIMIGLEKGGRVPVIESLSKNRMRKGLDMMVRGFRIYIGFNFYRTLGMRVDLNKSPFTGTLPHVLTQIAWLGYTPKAVYSVSFTPEGKMVTTPLKRGRVTTNWMLKCRSASGKLMKIVYLSQDISVKGFAKAPGVRKFLEKLPEVSGLFKAASYLPPRPPFKTITRICLSRMKSIVQDDSGIPYRMLKNDYKVTLYGKYRRAHGMFPSYNQPQLARLYRRRPRKALPFNFQYDRPDKSRNLMVARRK